MINLHPQLRHSVFHKNGKTEMIRIIAATSSDPSAVSAVSALTSGLSCQSKQSFPERLKQERNDIPCRHARLGPRGQSHHARRSAANLHLQPDGRFGAWSRG